MFIRSDSSSSQLTLLFSGEVHDDANEECSFEIKTCFDRHYSGKLRNDNPQSPALKKVPRPSVILPNTTNGFRTQLVLYASADRLYDRTEAKGFWDEQ